MSSKKIILIGSDPGMLLNFRKDLLKSLVGLGLSVGVLSNCFSEKQRKIIGALGVFDKSIKIDRNGLNILHDIKTFVDIFFSYQKTRPDIVLSYTIKPVVWGGIASKFFKIDFYALITGLGFAFQGDSFKRRMLTKLVIFLYRISLSKSKAVIFQNIDNRDLFIEKKIIPKYKAHVVDGSGVDVDRYGVAKIPDSETSFLCIARLIGEKGVREYFQAAKIVKQRFPNVKFRLIGDFDSSPDAIPLSEVKSWSGWVDYIGSVSDVRKYISECHVFVLPSYHEGLPRSTIEAMSIGRPILTTNAVGCKDTVKEGVNGFTVPIKSIKPLSKKIIWFIEHRDQVESMGLESRKMAEDRFDVSKINKEMLKIMGLQ